MDVAKERDRLKVLHEVKKRHITQKQQRRSWVERALVRKLLLRLRAAGDAGCGMACVAGGRTVRRQKRETAAVELYREKKQAKLWHDYGHAGGGRVSRAARDRD